MSTPMLEIQGLTAGYGKAEVLRQVSLHADAASVVTVIGPNGAGKSTMLNAIMGLLPSQGRIVMDGQDLSRLTLEERVMAGLALVPERRELFGTMTVEENLTLGGWRPRKLGRAGWEQGLEQAYDYFPRLKERRKQAAGTLSGGERQMLAIGRALIGQPRVLMLDEPSLGLAPLIVRDIFQIIARLRQDGVTVLLVEQNARAALRLADYGYVLETGDFVQQGRASELADDSRIVDIYLGKKEAA